MLTAATIQRILDLLAQGNLTDRQIARLTGVSRASVTRIARGYRPHSPQPRRSSPSPSPKPADSPQRCPHCGAKVYLPCRRCRLERQFRAGRVPLLPAWPETDLQLQLSDAQLHRYHHLHLSRLTGQTRDEEP